MDAASALRLAGRLAAATGRPLVPGDGYTDDELRTAEVRLGVVLPEVLRRVYEMLGRRGDLVTVQDLLLPPHELSIDPSGTVVAGREPGVRMVGRPHRHVAVRGPTRTRTV